MDAANEGGLHHMVKRVSFWDDTDNELFACQLDSDDCVRANQQTAKAVDFRLKKLDSTLKKKFIEEICMEKEKLLKEKSELWSKNLELKLKLKHSSLSQENLITNCIFFFLTLFNLPFLGLF